jgi:hypothetical protein
LIRMLRDGVVGLRKNRLTIEEERDYENPIQRH